MVPGRDVLRLAGKGQRVREIVGFFATAVQDHLGFGLVGLGFWGWSFSEAWERAELL